MDWMHVGEVVVGNVFVAGVAYGAIKTDLRAIRDRLTRCETDIRSTGARIDELLLKGE